MGASVERFGKGLRRVNVAETEESRGDAAERYPAHRVSTGTASTYGEVRDEAQGLDLWFVQEEEEYWPEVEYDSLMLVAVGKGTMCSRAATMAVMPEAVPTSLQARPSGQARARTKERQEETAKGARHSSMRKGGGKGGKGKEKGVEKNGYCDCGTSLVPTELTRKWNTDI